MRCSFVAATLIASCAAHGVVISMDGTNNVTMPGLSVADGTPRDCTTNRCGAEADTSIIRDREISSGKATPLGRTQGNGPVSADAMISSFMGTGAAPTNDGAASSVGQEDDIDTAALGDGGAAAAAKKPSRRRRGLLDGLLGGAGTSAGVKGNTAPESSVSKAAGTGANSGLPTCSDSGEINMTFRQINQDGAGPLTADVDSTSGGTDASAFKTAEVTQDVPGIGIGGLSKATNTDFPVKVQLPAGTTCDGTVGGVINVCIARVRNAALAGPFGGSVAFTQSAAGRKRALAYRLKKRMEISRE